MENPFCKTVSEPVFENNNIEIIQGKLTDPYKAYIIRYYELFDFHSYKLLLIAVSNKLVVMLKKKYFTGILLIIFFSFAHNNLCGQKNLGFESGLEGWIVSGLVNLETSDCAFKGNHCIKLELKYFSGSVSIHYHLFNLPLLVNRFQKEYKGSLLLGSTTIQTI